MSSLPGSDALEHEIARAIEEARTSRELSEQEISQIESVVRGGEPADLPAVAKAELPPETPIPGANADSPEDKDLRQRLLTMGVAERIKLAIFGNMLARGLLIRDPLRLIQLFVLKNARLTLREVEEFTRNPNLSEHVLRTIANSSSWMKNYPIKLHLVTNPKTPGDVALKWLRYLSIADLKRISKSKQVPHVVAMAARKKTVEAEEGK